MEELTKAEIERLALVAEECAEVIQVIGKILRHGYESYNPFDENKTPNRQLLEKEISHLVVGVYLMSENHDVGTDSMDSFARKKAANIQQYLHYNTIPEIFKDED